MGILSLLLWMPALGVFLLLFIPAQAIHLLRWTSNLFAVFTLLIAVTIMLRYDAFNPALQLGERIIFDIELDNVYALGVDGISLPMLLLTSFFTVIAVLISSSIMQRVKTFYVCIGLVEFGVLGVFLAQDWALFYAFWEATLIPLFFLIDRWGGEYKHKASLNFVLYALMGSVFILAGLFALEAYMPEQGGSLMTEMGEAAQTMPIEEQVLVFISFLIGFGVKIPIFPMHGWLPLAQTEAPTPVNILLSGVVLNLGAYGLLRVILMLPVAVELLQPVLLTLALFSIIYGGLLAWRQNDLKAMLAYASISHMGVVLLGFSTLNLTGLTGAVLQMSGQGLIAGALFLLVGILVERTGTSNIQNYSSLAPVMPRFAILTTFMFLAGMGLPGSIGFIAELHAIIGGFERWGAWMVIYSLSLLVSAAYAIRTIGLLFMGPTKPDMFFITDIQRFELIAATLLATAILLLGIFPDAIIDLSIATLAQQNNVMIERVL